MSVFVNQKKHRTTGAWDNGCVVRDTVNDALHQYHAFMSTYGYGYDATVDYCSCSVESESGAIIKGPEVDDRREGETWQPEQ